MGRMRLASILLVVMCFSTALAALSCSTGGTGSSTTTAAAVDPVVRGRYLVTIMGCNDCHTPGYLYGQPEDAATTRERLAGKALLVEADTCVAARREPRKPRRRKAG